MSKDGTSLIIAEKHKIDNVNESSGLLIYSFKDGTFSQTAVKTFEGTALEYDSISQITVSEDGGFIALNFVYGRFFAKISNGEIASYDYDAAKLYITGNWYLKGNQLIVARTTDNEHKLEVYEFTDDMQIVRVMSEFVDFGDQVDSSSWNQGSLSPDGKTFYSVAKGQLFIYSFDLSQKSLKLIGKSDVIAGLDKSAIKEFKAGNDGVYVLGNDGSLVKYLASVGGGVTVGSEIAVNGDASLSIAADGSLLVREGTITKIYQPGYFASMGDTVSFAAGMQLSDVNLDKLNDYAGASLQFSTESGNGVFSFGADGYKLEGSYIVASNGRTIAQFSQGGGAATIQFLQGTTAADADAVLRGMSVRQSVNAPGNEVITVRFSDGTSGTPSEVETKVVFAANAVPDVTLGGSESETFTKAGTEVAVFPDVSIDLGNPGQSVQKVVIQVSGIAADSTREYLLIGDQKIALQTASQIEMGGVAYAWTVRNGVGTLTITPGAAMEAAAMEAIIEGIKYGNESAAGEAGSFAHGEHVFTIKSIQDNGGTASGGVDTAEPGVSRTLTIDVNTPPQIAFETDSASGSFSKDVYDYAGDLEGFSGYVKGVTVSDDGKTVFVTAFAGKVNTNPPTTLLVYSRDPVTGELKLSQVFNGDGAEFNGMQGTQVEGFGRIALVKMVGTDVYVTAQYTDADGKTVYCIQRFTYANGTLSNLKLLSYTNKDGLQGLDGSIDDLEVVGDRLYVATGAHYGLGYGKGETGKSIVAYQITADGLTVVQDAVQLGDNVRPIAISFSADGRYAFVAGSDKLIHVFSVNADGSLTEESGKAVTAPSTDSRTPSIYDMEMSPDGTRLYVMTATGGPLLSVFNVSSDGSLTPLQTVDLYNGHYLESAMLNGLDLALSADGSHLVCGSYSRSAALFSIEADGSVKFQMKLQADGTYSSALAFAPDGSSIYMGAGFGQANGEGLSIFKPEPVVGTTDGTISIGKNLTFSDLEADNNTPGGDYQGFTFVFTRPEGDASSAGTFSFAASADVLLKDGRITYAGRDVGSFTADGNTLTIRFDAELSKAEAQDIIGRVTYTAADISGTARLEVTITDSQQESANVSLLIAKHTAALSNPESTPLTNQDNAVLFPQLSFTADESTLEKTLSATISHSEDVAGKFGILLPDGMTLSGSDIMSGGTKIGSVSGLDAAGADLVITFEKGAGAEQIQNVLRAITYTNSTLKEGTDVTFSIAIKTADGQAVTGMTDAAVLHQNVNPSLNSEYENWTYVLYPGDEFSITVPELFTDADDPKLSWTVTGLPEGMSFDPATHVLSGTGPTETGDLRLTFTATDGKGTPVSKEIVFKVSAEANRAPEADPDFAIPAINAGDPVSIKLSGLFTDPNGDSMTLSVDEDALEALGLSYDADTQTITGTPTKSGELKFTVTAEDDRGLKSSKELTLTVNNQNPALIPGADTTIEDFSAGKEVRKDLSSIFTDPDGQKLQFTFEKEPTDANIRIDGNTLVIGSGTQAGPYSLTVVADDGFGGTKSIQFEFTITNEPPVYSGSDTFNWVVNNAADFDLKSYCSDPNGDASISISLEKGSTLPDGLTLDGGVLKGAPTQAGTYQVVIRISDGNGASVTQELNLFVRGNELPQINNDFGLPEGITIDGGFIKITAGENYHVDVSNLFIDPDGDEVHLTVTGLPDGLVFDPESKTISGTTNEVGLFIVQVTADDDYSPGDQNLVGAPVVFYVELPDHETPDSVIEAPVLYDPLVGAELPERLRDTEMLSGLFPVLSGEAPSVSAPSLATNRFITDTFADTTAAAYLDRLTEMMEPDPLHSLTAAEERRVEARLPGVATTTLAAEPPVPAAQAAQTAEEVSARDAVREEAADASADAASSAASEAGDELLMEALDAAALTAEGKPALTEILLEGALFDSAAGRTAAS